MARGFKSGHFPDVRGTLSSMPESSMSDLLAARSNYRHADGALILSKHCHDFSRGLRNDCREAVQSNECVAPSGYASTEQPHLGSPSGSALYNE